MIIFDVIPVERVSDYSVLYLFPLLSLLYLSVIKLSYPKSIGFIFSGFYNARIFRQILGENIARTHQVSKLLLINVLIVLMGVVSVFLSSIGRSSFTSFVYATLLVFLYYLARIVVNYSTSFLSGNKDLMKESMVYNRFYLGVLGVMLLPGLICLLFLPVSNTITINGNEFKAGLLILSIRLVISYIAKMVVILSKSVQLKVSSYYIFLYLCTLEILPLVVVIRLLIGEF